MNLYPQDIPVLKFLDLEGGFTTGQIARHVGGATNKRKRAALVHQQLLFLEKEGFVRRLDPNKPVIWALTQTGRDAVQKLPEPQS